jgi:hypothetical protein
LGLAIHQDSLERSLRGDTAAHAKWREQALKGLGLGQRTELDITGRSDDKWLSYLTDSELESLETLHKAAMQRMNTPPHFDMLRDNPQSVPAIATMAGTYTQSANFTENMLSDQKVTVQFKKVDDGE